MRSSSSVGKAAGRFDVVSGCMDLTENCPEAGPLRERLHSGSVIVEAPEWNLALLKVQLSALAETAGAASGSKRARNAATGRGGVAVRWAWITFYQWYPLRKRGDVLVAGLGWRQNGAGVALLGVV